MYYCIMVYYVMVYKVMFNYTILCCIVLYRMIYIYIYLYYNKLEQNKYIVLCLFYYSQSFAMLLFCYATLLDVVLCFRQYMYI